MLSTLTQLLNSVHQVTCEQLLWSEHHGKEGKYIYYREESSHATLSALLWCLSNARWVDYK